jgi:hypothetical protein
VPLGGWGCRARTDRRLLRRLNVLVAHATLPQTNSLLRLTRAGGSAPDSRSRVRRDRRSGQQ